MKENELFILADRALVDVVGQIKDDQWDLPIPEWFTINQKNKNITLRNIIEYHAYDEAWVPEVLAGKTIAEVGDKYTEGELLGDDPKQAYSDLAEKAIAAAKEADLDRTVHLTYGDWLARDYLLHTSSFRGFRVYDISKLIGIETKMPAELVQGMWDLLSPHADEWRKLGVYKPAIKVPSDTDLQTKLLAMRGQL